MYWNTLIFLAEYLLKSCSDLLGKPTGVFTGEQSNNASILTARLYIELATINITLLIFNQRLLMVLYIIYTSIELQFYDYMYNYTRQVKRVGGVFPPPPIPESSEVSPLPLLYGCPSQFICLPPSPHHFGHAM